MTKIWLFVRLRSVVYSNPCQRNHSVARREQAWMTEYTSPSFVYSHTHTHTHMSFMTLPIVGTNLWSLWPTALTMDNQPVLICTNNVGNTWGRKNAWQWYPMRMRSDKMPCACAMLVTGWGKLCFGQAQLTLQTHVGGARRTTKQLRKSVCTTVHML